MTEQKGRKTEISMFIWTMKMRRNISILLLAAFSLAACTMAEQDTDRNVLKSPAKTIRVNFTTGEETKAAFGEFNDETSSYPTFWTESDNFIAMTLDYAGIVEADVTINPENNGRASFSADFEDSGAPYQFFALCPLSAADAASASRGSWAVTIPTVQTPKDDGLSCDEAAMLLYAKSGSLETLPSTPISMKFSHITTYCRLTLKNLAAAFDSFSVTDPSVKSVDLSFSVPVAGEWYVDASDGTLEAKEASHTITVRPTVTDLTQPVEMWLALAPCTLDGATVKVSVNTDKGSLSRSYTYGTRTYAAGAVNKLSLDMSKNASFDEYAVATEETVFELVKTIGDLNKDDEVIFVDGVSPSYAMTSTFKQKTGLASVAKDAEKGFTYDSTDGYIRLPEGSSAMVMTVASKSNSSITFKYGNQYLASAYSGSTHYPTLAASARTYTLYQFDEGELALYYSSNSGSTIYSLYHSSNYFRMYSSSSSQVATLSIYRKKTLVNTSGVDPDNDPILQQEQYGAYLADRTIGHTPGLTQLSREYSGSTLTFAILFPSDNEVLEFNGIPSSVTKGDVFNLDVRIRVGGKNTAVGSYGVTAIREDGAKVWLSDFNGNGFIVKR